MRKTRFAMTAIIAALLIIEANSKGTLEQKIPDLEEGNTHLRQLGFDFNVHEIYYLKTVFFLGYALTYSYRVSVQNGKAYNQLIIMTNEASYMLGNNGVDTETSNTWSGKIKLISFRFPPIPTIGLNLYASGSLQYSVKYATSSKDSLKLSLSGKLIPIVEIATFPGSFVKVTAKADGVLIDSSGDATVTKSGITKGFKFYGTIVNTWIEGKSGVIPITKKKYKLFDAWSYN